MALIRAKQAIFDMRAGFTRILDAARDLRELQKEYSDAGLLTLWENNSDWFTEHGFTYQTLVAALDDFTAADTAPDGIQAKDDNWKRVRN